MAASLILSALIIDDYDDLIIQIGKNWNKNLVLDELRLSLHRNA